MRIRAEIALISTVAFLTGCNINSISPVHAQANYSDASVEGTYSVSLSGITSATGFDPSNPTGTTAELSNFIGSFKADGSGDIASGTLTELGANESSVITCTVTFQGEYKLKSDATGTVAITVASTGTNGSSSENCKWSGPVQFLIQAGMYGESLHFVEADGKGLISGVATRQ